MIGVAPPMMTESAFDRLAGEALEELALEIESKLGDRLEVELREGILTVDLEDGGRYQINKHVPMRQLWLASPKSGAWHFACGAAGGPWISTRDPSTTLGSLLRDELRAATGVFLDLTL